MPLEYWQSIAHQDCTLCSLNYDQYSVSTTCSSGHGDSRYLKSSCERVVAFSCDDNLTEYCAVRVIRHDNNLTTYMAARNTKEVGNSGLVVCCVGCHESAK